MFELLLILQDRFYKVDSSISNLKHDKIQGTYLRVDRIQYVRLCHFSAQNHQRLSTTFNRIFLITYHGAL